MVSGRSVGCLIALLVVAGPSTAQEATMLTLRTARAVVGRYLRAELAGQDRATATKLYGCRGAYDQGTDFVLPVARASIIDAHLVADTAWVRVQYLVLGRAFLGKRSTFADSVRPDTASFPIVRDSTGTARVGCSHLEADHYSVTAMQRFIPRLDPPSRRAWNRALAAARHQ